MTIIIIVILYTPTGSRLIYNYCRLWTMMDVYCTRDKIVLWSCFIQGNRCSDGITSRARTFLLIALHSHEINWRIDYHQTFRPYRRGRCNNIIVRFLSVGCERTSPSDVSFTNGARAVNFDISLIKMLVNHALAVRYKLSRELQVGWYVDIIPVWLHSYLRNVRGGAIGRGQDGFSKRSRRPRMALIENHSLSERVQKRQTLSYCLSTLIRILQ